ncbi:MAG: hypothetical protein MJ152_03880 [Clostridia bacterium]|nr:hypothetical protein [Clostridia bacterium]
MIYWEKPTEKFKKFCTGTIYRLFIKKNNNDINVDIKVSMNKVESSPFLYVHYILPNEEQLLPFLTDLCNNVAAHGASVDVESIEQAESLLYGVPITILMDKKENVLELVMDQYRGFSFEKFKNNHPEFYPKNENELWNM